ncbi:unnamed protein product [Acanthoscelides obtectus]|uniref:Uncharacterized protein n=1 Tax=Acanthoscelides obtectus TaxID=200917 RepID=A0A9P0P8X5_ACAOB|nr:unnamed protein product [Acanthoscelides obtectus]CAK1647173.1 hypothetical protein AOBTE_LOCUS15088 [Acanthoscelides obtectus]
MLLASNNRTYTLSRNVACKQLILKSFSQVIFQLL